MVIIAGTARIRPEARDDLLDAARRMIAASRAEPGCTAYRYAFDIDDPDLIHFFEEWQDQAAVDAHFATPHMAEFLAALGDTLDGPPTILRYDVSSFGPLFG